MRNAKHAFWGSVVALILCFMMLIGTTYAWFTDSVSSDNNNITAGNLDIELYHTNKIDTEEQVTETTKLFDDVDAKLWEPNAMAYEKFLLKNVGDLDLEYQLSLNASNATVIDGVSFASMLKVAVITNETYVYDRATISSDTSLVWNDLATFELEGTLLDGANTTYGIVIWWQPSANDNLFNMNNERKGQKASIDVSVQLVATQMASEEDSFDGTYDEEADFPGISMPAPIPAEDVTEPITLNAKGMSITVPAEVINALDDDVTSLSLVYSAPEVEGNAITFPSVDLVDQNGEKVDLSANTVDIPMTLPAQNLFAADEVVFIYHDDEFVAMATVNADGTISYTVPHLCEITVSSEFTGESLDVRTAEDFLLACKAAGAGNVITLLEDITLAEETKLPAGIILNGNGKQINGSVYAGGDLTIAGHLKVTGFSASYYNRTITIGAGACLEVTGTGRITLGYGNVFNITGTLTDAKTADKATVQPSLIIPGGISITGGNDAAMNVTNAYVKIGNTSSKNSAANGTFTLNFTNSIAEFTNQFTLSEPTGGKNPTFNLTIKDSVFSTATKLCIAAPNSTVEIDNSIVTLGSYLRNSGEITLKNNSVLTGATIQFGENGGNNGTIKVDNSELTIKAGTTGHAFDGKGIGSIVLTNGAKANVDYYKDMTVECDETSTFTGTDINAQ